ncbi:MAG: hypothetical protein R2932_52030 [Caldilineaceae bacterium]
MAELVVDHNNLAYVGLADRFYAFDSAGAMRWLAEIPTYSYIYPQIRLSNDDSHFYFEDVVSHTADGKRQFLETAEPLDKYIVGVDGQTYLVSQTAIFQAQIAETGVTFAPYAHWDTLSLGAGFRLPQDAGVLPDGRIWIFYAGQYEVGKFLWLERTGAVDALIDLPWNQGSAYLVGLDGQASVYLCGLRQIASNNRFTECRAYRWPERSAVDRGTSGNGASGWRCTGRRSALRGDQ